MTSKPKIGWIGLGKMGIPMSKNLLKAGFPLTVYNRNVEKTKELVSEGAEVADSIASLAQEADIVFSMISDDQGLKAVALGTDAVLENSREGTIYVDMSTVSPEASALVAAEAAERNVAYLRAPVSGSTVVAAAALLTILASGPKEAYDNCVPAFEAMGKSLFHVGEDEEARYLKLTLNMMVGTSAAMVGEALTFGERGGMDWEKMLDIIDASVVASPLVKYKIQALKDRDYAPAFTAAQMGKDFDIALDAARQMDVPMPLTAQVRQNWSAMKANGKGELDFFAYVSLLEELAGIRPSP